MTQHSPAPSIAPDPAEGLRGLRWLLTRLVSEVSGLRSVVVVSSDGLPLLTSDPDAPSAAPATASRGPGGAVADLAAVVSGLASITAGAAELMDGGRVKQTMVAMADGNLLVMAISDGSLLGVHTTPDADSAQVAYQMALFVGRAGHLLTPELRARLREDGGAAGTGTVGGIGDDTRRPAPENATD